MNKVFLIGNLTRDPELTETASGVPVCHFSIAVNRNYSSQDGERQTDFFNCTAWRAMAETIARYTKKGKKVAVGYHRSGRRIPFAERQRGFVRRRERSASSSWSKTQAYVASDGRRQRHSLLIDGKDKIF